jgi:hypothetical protein
MVTSATGGIIQIFISQPVGPRGTWRVWESGRMLAEYGSRDDALLLARNRSLAARRVQQSAEIKVELPDGAWQVVEGTCGAA